MKAPCFIKKVYKGISNVNIGIIGESFYGDLYS